MGCTTERTRQGFRQSRFGPGTVGSRGPHGAGEGLGRAKNAKPLPGGDSAGSEGGVWARDIPVFHDFKDFKCLDMKRRFFDTLLVLGPHFEGDIPGNASVEP